MVIFVKNLVIYKKKDHSSGQYTAD